MGQEGWRCEYAVMTYGLAYARSCRYIDCSMRSIILHPCVLHPRGIILHLLGKFVPRLSTMLFLPRFLFATSLPLEAVGSRTSGPLYPASICDWTSLRLPTFSLFSPVLAPGQLREIQSLLHSHRGRWSVQRGCMYGLWG